MMTDEEIEELRNKLRKDGYTKVKKDLASSVYGRGKGKKAQVELWLQEKYHEDQKIDKEREFDIGEKGNLIAWFALAVSIIALGVSIFDSMIVSHFNQCLNPLRYHPQFHL